MGAYGFGATIPNQVSSFVRGRQPGRNKGINVGDNSAVNAVGSDVSVRSHSLFLRSFPLEQTRNTLFIGTPLEDIENLVGLAKSQGASSLLLLSDQAPVWRIDGVLAPPHSQERLHFSQLESLVNVLLTQSEKDAMEQNGSVEVEREIGCNAVRLHVFYASGSHNVVVYIS